MFQVNYITLPGWETSTEGVRTYDDLPENARKYVELIEEKLELPGWTSDVLGCKLWLIHFFFFSSMDWSRQGSWLYDSTLLV